MKKITVAFLMAAGILASSSSAKVSFNLKIDSLTSGGEALSKTGLLVLVVDSDDDGIGLPTAGSFGEEVVAKWDLVSEGPGKAALTLLSGGVEYGANWNVGDPLALLWFPSLADSDLPSGTEEYGIFTDSLGFTSGGDWEMPMNNVVGHSLNLITATASTLVMAGSGEVPDGAGAVLYAVGGASPEAAPVPSSLVVVHSSNGSVSVSWMGASNPNGGYIVRRAPTGSTTWETVGFVAGDIETFTDTDVKPGLKYDYQILAQGGISVAQSDTTPTIETDRSVFKSVAARSRIIASSPSTQMFGGVIVEGTDPTKNIVMQALGRSYFSADNFVSDPAIALYNKGSIIASSNDWLDQANAVNIDTAMSEGNAFVLTDDGTSKDASILIDAQINEGYSFAIESKDGSDGDIFLGILNADSSTLGENDNRIVSLAVRGYLDDPDPNSLFVGGIQIVGDVPKEVLVLAFGPYLSGVVDTSLDGKTIENPSLVLRLGGTSTVIATNDDWENQSAATNAAAVIDQDTARIAEIMSSLSFQPYASGALDSALLVTLNPGPYTFEITGSGGSGIGFIQIDEIEEY